MSDFNRLDRRKAKPASAAAIGCVVLGELMRLLIGHGLFAAAGAVTERLILQPRLVPIPLEERRLTARRR